MTTAHLLTQTLHRLDGRSYSAYKSLQGRYAFDDFDLHIDYVQGDPFAAPSQLRVQVPMAIANFPPDLYRTPSRAVALRDYLTRQFAAAAHGCSGKRGSGKSGLIAIAPPSQSILDRTAILATHQGIEARFVVGLPARGRSILGRQAAALLCEDLPTIVRRSLHYSHLNATELTHHVETVEDTDWLRSQLEAHHLVAFIPDGAVLPRQSGVNDAPLTHQAEPFQSPDSLRVSFHRPNHGLITGMGVPEGISLIVGGGYHGKSTLLQAIAVGIYNHIPGDGREHLVTHAQAVKVRAEDGRSIAGVNLSPFINHLPQGRSTTHFSTENASGSTSQAASIIEAVEAGAKVLLVDEDTSATNFMIRDRRMQALIAKDREPITPFIDKIRQLYWDYGVSTVLVMGGSGDYFDVADTVIAMTNYQPQDVTQQARAIAIQYATQRQSESGSQFGTLSPRIPLPMGNQRVASSRRFQDHRDAHEPEMRSPKLKVRDVDELLLGHETIDLSALEQLVEVNQVRAIGAAIAQLQPQFDGVRSLMTLVEALMQQLTANGFETLDARPSGQFAQFRVVDLAMVINRWRSLSIRSSASHPPQQTPTYPPKGN
ncbi:ABC-ATPase domain-containing protein [Leptolyngbya sp. AN02str]|uniref:ABC-ATPase domain-containing protein n=1 Tax=Leptolyngbya sp. AN02str TaxID=3423363 RepID=UPI003D3215B9